MTGKRFFDDAMAENFSTLFSVHPSSRFQGVSESPCLFEIDTVG